MAGVSRVPKLLSGSMTRYNSTGVGARLGRPARPLNIAMLLANTGVGDARAIKEAECLAAAGHAVTVFGLAGRGLAAEEQISGVRYVRLRERHRGAAASSPAPVAPGQAISRGLARLYNSVIAPYIRHELNAATFTAAVATARPDIIHAHDFETLPAAVRAAGRCGARVIYDMQEAEEGRSPIAGPTLARWKTWVERRALRRVSATIAASPSIASVKARKYGIPLPTVVDMGLPAGPGLICESPLTIHAGTATGRPHDTLVCPDAAKLEALRARDGWRRQAERLLEFYDAVANGPRGLPVGMARRALATSLRPAHAFTAGS